MIAGRSRTSRFPVSGLIDLGGRQVFYRKNPTFSASLQRRFVSQRQPDHSQISVSIHTVARGFANDHVDADDFDVPLFRSISKRDRPSTKLAKLADATKIGDVFGNVDIAFGIETGIVRRDELALDPLRSYRFPSPSFPRRVEPKRGEDLRGRPLLAVARLSQRESEGKPVQSRDLKAVRSPLGWVRTNAFLFVRHQTLRIVT